MGVVEHRTGAKRGGAAACRMGKSPPLRGGGLLDGRCCGGRGECHTSPLNMYAAYVGAAMERRRPLRPDLSRTARRAPRISLRENRGRVRGGRQAARSIGRLDGTGAAASRRRTVSWAMFRRARRMAHIAPGYVRRRCGRRRFFRSGLAASVSRRIRILLYPALFRPILP